jgi:hypothetical protein
MKNEVNLNYKKLIQLAEELDTPSTQEKIDELNRLLSGISVDIIDEDHYQLIDDLITILHNTNNIHDKSLIELQERIRKLNT